MDKEQHPDNYIRLVKCLILLYLHDNKSGSHPHHWSAKEGSHIPDLLVDLSAVPDCTPFWSRESLLLNLWLHPADFRVISMIRFGTVVFPKETNTLYTIIDQSHLEQGRVAVMVFKPNADIAECANLYSNNFGTLLNFHWGLGRSFSDLFDEDGDFPYSQSRCNQP